MTAASVPWGDPEFAALRTAQQAELRARYGGDDIGHDMTGEDILDAVVLHHEGVAAACGALRDAPELGPGTGELKRMYVLPSHRGRGLSRRVVDQLEAAARRRGLTRLVLETGVLQPEAIGLYLSAGYVPIDRFPPYEHETTSRAFAKDLTAPPAARERARNGVDGLVVDRVGWTDPAAVALRREMAAVLRGCYGPVGWFADDETVAATDTAESGRALVVLVVRDGATPVGTVTLSSDPEGRPSDWGELERVLTLPTARGRGVARLMLRAVEDEARARGLVALTLTTGYRQHPAIAMYLAAGYRIVAPAGDSWPRQDRLLWFAKDLSLSSPGPPPG